MTHKLKIGMAVPMTDGGFRTGKKIVQNGDFMAQEHEAVDKMGTNETGTASDQNALTAGRREELYGREPSKCSV
jgi:hypothetical protein